MKMQKLKLFCLPYAGASARIYLPWQKQIGEFIQIVPVELSGRGEMFETPFYNNINEAVTDLYNRLHSQFQTGDFAFFGHSLGSLIVFELCRRLKELNQKMPVHIFLSGGGTPDIPKSVDKTIHNLPDDEFANEILKLGGTPQMLFTDRQLAETFIPILRADYKLFENYQYGGINPLNVDMTILHGRDDQLTKGKIDGWKKHTIKSCTIYEIDGGHFFIHQKSNDVLKIINNVLLNKKTISSFN